MNSFTKKQIGFAAFTYFIYTLLVGWKAALLLVVGVGFHEYSHLWAAKRMGMATKGFFLVPFMGGVALVDGKYKTYAQQAFVVLAGPVGGGLLAVATAGVYLLTGIPFLAAAATWMCFLNLFNLLPLSFMDGGQLLGTVTYSLNKTFGMVCHTVSTLVAIFVVWHFNPVIAVIIALFGGIGVVTEIRNWYNFRKGETYLCSEEYLHPPSGLTKGQMALTVGGWALTAATLLGVMTWLSSHPAANMANIFKH